MKICSACGQKAGSNDEVCSACGGALTEKKLAGLIAAIIIIIALIGGAIGYGIYYFTDEPESAPVVEEKGTPNEETENPSDVTSEEEKEEIKELAEEALDLIITRNQDALMDKMVDSDPQSTSNTAILSKFRSYDAVTTKFEALVDSLELTEEERKEIKDYGYEKVNAVYANFCTNGISDIKKSSNGMVVASAKADLLNTSDVEYNLVYDKIAEYTNGKALNEMAVDEIKSVIDSLFNDIESYVVDTDVVLQYKKIDNEWKINNVAISATE